MKLLRKILFPFSILYGGVTALRNICYNRGWLKSKSYPFPVICVGNLTTGGTGKTPMIEFLIMLLKGDYNVAVLSRGYKRNTKGYVEVLTTSTVQETGDEPLQFKQKFPDVAVAVCENRQVGVEKLAPIADIVLLDDAFQHRKVKASFNILLTQYNQLYTDDYMLPTGNLREPRSGAKRANIVVVTKCPETLNTSRITEITKKLNLNPNQELYFSKIGYAATIKNKTETHPLQFLADKNFTLVTGIAKPEQLVEYLKNRNFNFRHKSFPDHHNFSISEIEELTKHLLILTTEKDFMRLQQLMDTTNLYYLPISTVFLDATAVQFKERIVNSLNTLK